MGQEEELLRIAKKLEKMVARKNTEGALDLLKKLNSWQMSIQLLQTTRIGVAVNGVRKHCSDKEVVSLAKVLIRNWKQLLAPPKGGKGEERVKAKKENGLDCSDWKPETSLSPPRKKRVEEPKDRRDSVDSKSSATSSPKRPSMERSNSGKPKAETPRTPSSPSSPTFAPSVCILAPCYLTGDSVRDKCVEMLSAALKADDDYKDYGVNCDKMASEIEDHIYQELKSTDMKYRNRVRSRISNLKDPRNPGLRRNVLSGAISSGLIAKMTAEEMASDELRELRNAMTQEAIREHQMAKTGGTTTDLFQCSKCKKKNCTYNQVQTRSADEPMTTFVLCNECGNRWKPGMLSLASFSTSETPTVFASELRSYLLCEDSSPTRPRSSSGGSQVKKEKSTYSQKEASRQAGLGESSCPQAGLRNKRNGERTKKDLKLWNKGKEKA
ncbi:PREDICTED: transcription elongation factor A protein 3 [Lipotes vexillifer]|uniref:Transcription elongation factor A protein 3 n=1 Tax=Lipotes vexillifer TaxID=118797 RepID=A0A340XJA0_LIPVE|nr:PREDICTED: transcription elongation factor A protein 3 [Lipotes vexillifer]